MKDEIRDLESVVDKLGKSIETQIYILEQFRAIIKKILSFLHKKEE
jgi:hypothetical protein